MTTETGEIGKRAVSKSDLTATSAKQRSGTNAGLNYGQDFSWTSANAFSAELIAAVRFKLTEKFVPILAARPDVANIPDNEGRTLMSYVASHAEGLEELMEVANINWDVIDKQGDSLLHFAVSHNCPMSAFLLAKQAPETCLLKNKNGKNPVEIAHDRHCGEVLNALLLGCCSEEANPKDSNSPAKDAIRILLDFGAVPDTWAPNGRSALMLAATADSPETIQLLLDKKADISLRDTLNRTALMFASASGGEASVKVLMENGGQQALSAQCNKGWNALGYAEHPGVRTLIEKKFEQLEKAARENEKALLAQVQEETNKETAKKQKKSHRGQKKKRKGKRDATVETLNEPPQEIQEIDTPRSTEGSIERDHINKFSIQEIEDESLMHEFDREEESQNARLECEDGALEDEFRKEAEVDKEEGFGKTNPVVLVHCDSRSDVIKDALDTMLGNQYTDSHTEPKDPQFSKPAEDIISEIGKQANLNQNYDLACSSDQIQIPLVEEEYESWERRYEEDDSTWQEVKKDAKKEARKEKRQESKKQSNKPNQAEEETLGHASRQRQSIPVDPITLSELQQSEDSTLVSPPKECPQDSIPSQSKPIKEDPKIQAMQEPPPGLSNSQPLPSKATDTNCSWANVVQGKANLMEAIMCSSMSAPELGELEIPQTTDRKGSLPHPIIQNSCADQLRTHPNFSAAPSLLDSLRKQTFKGGDQNPSIGSIDGSIDLALAEEVNRLKQENSGLLAQLTQAEVSRHQREELLQQLQQAHALELNQARHLAASNSKRQEAEKLSLQNEISRLQLELAKARQLANRLSEVFTQIQNTSQNHQPQAAPTPFQNNMNLQQNNLSLMRQNNLQNLQSSLVNAIRGNTAQAALRQLNLNGNSSHTGLLNNVQSPYQNGMTPFQRGMRERPFQAIDPVKQIPQNSQPSLIQHNHQNGVQTAQIGTPRGPSQNFPIFSQLKQDIPNNEHAQTNGPSITPGSQTVREEKSPWNSGPSKFEGSKSGLFDSIWSMQQPSQSAVKPDTQAIWQSLSAQKEQQTAISL